MYIHIKNLLQTNIFKYSNYFSLLRYWLIELKEITRCKIENKKQKLVCRVEIINCTFKLHL